MVIYFLILLASLAWATRCWAVIDCLTGSELDSLAFQTAVWDTVPNGSFSAAFNANFTFLKHQSLNPNDWSASKLDSFADLILNDWGNGYTEDDSYAFRTAAIFGVNLGQGYPDIFFDYVWKGSNHTADHFYIRLNEDFGNRAIRPRDIYIDLPDGVTLSVEEIAEDHFAHEWAHLCYYSTGSTGGDGCGSFGEDFNPVPPGTYPGWDNGTHEFMAKSSEYFNGMTAENWYGPPRDQPFTVGVARNDWYEDCRRELLIREPPLPDTLIHVKGEDRRWTYYPFSAYLQDHFDGATTKGLLYDWIQNTGVCESESAHVGPHDLDQLAQLLDDDFTYSDYFDIASDNGDARLSELFQEYALSMWVNSDHLFDGNPEASVHMPQHPGSSPRADFNYFASGWCRSQALMRPFPAFVGVFMDSIVGPIQGDSYPGGCAGSIPNDFDWRREFTFDSYSLNYLPFIADSILWDDGRCYNLEVEIVLDDEYQCFDPGDYVAWTPSSNDLLHFYVLGYPDHVDSLDTRGATADLLGTYTFTDFEAGDVFSITAPCFGSVYKSVVLVATLTELVASSGTAYAQTVPFHYRFRAAEPGDKTIYTDTTWRKEDGPVCIGGQITVANNTTLTIEPGMEIWCANPDSVYGVSKVGFSILGSLNLVGTAEDSVQVLPFDGYWDGFSVSPSGSLLVDHAKVSGLKKIYCNPSSGPVEISNSVFDLADDATGFDLRHATVASIDDCIIENASQIFLEDHTINGTRIHQSAGQNWTALTIEGDATVSDVVIYSAKTSIKCTDGSPTLSYVSANSADHQDCGRGATYGLIAEGSSDVMLDHCTFDGFCRAVRVKDTAQLRMRNSEIIDAGDIGVYIESKAAYADLGQDLSPPVLGMQGLNCIDTEDGSDFRVFNTSTLTCDAAWNYWGTDTPTASLFHGPVTWTPYDTTCATGAGGPDFSLGQHATTPSKGWSLSPPRPNPFNPSCEIDFSLPATGVGAELVVYDLSGRRLVKLFGGVADGQAYTIEWNGRDERGTPVSSGVYFARLQVGSETRSRKLVVLK